MDDEEVAFKQKQREEAKKLEEARNKAAQKGNLFFLTGSFLAGS
jgi:hypothetical protein